MSAQWPHHLRIFAPLAGAGATDDDGVWIDDPTTANTEDLYNGRADVQDGGKMFDQNLKGEFSSISDAVAFLKDESAIVDLVKRENLRAEITWEDQTTDIADVVKVRRLDGTIWLKRL